MTWKIGPVGGSMTTLDSAEGVRAIRFGDGSKVIAGLRGDDPVIAHRHGARRFDRYYFEPLVFPLEVYFDTDADSKFDFEQRLYGVGGICELRYTDGTLGEVATVVRQIGQSSMLDDQRSFEYTLVAHEGSWRSVTQTTDSSTPVANSGNAPVHDAVIDIDTSASGTDVVVTMTADGATISIDGATPTGGVRVDLDEGTVTKISDGSDYFEAVSFSKPYGIILEPGDNAFTTTGSPSEVTFKFYPRVR